PPPLLSPITRGDPATEKATSSGRISRVVSEPPPTRGVMREGILKAFPAGVRNSITRLACGRTAVSWIWAGLDLPFSTVISLAVRSSSFSFVSSPLVTGIDSISPTVMLSRAGSSDSTASISSLSIFSFRCTIHSRIRSSRSLTAIITSSFLFSKWTFAFFASFFDPDAFLGGILQ
ncbi:hypothetical protein PENTCL1PPCAC_1247, partial [Pristionchus entomophagus]